MTKSFPPDNIISINSTEQLKKGAELVDDDVFSKALEKENSSALSLYEKARDAGSAQLYTSLSNVIKWSAIGLSICAFILIITWFCLECHVSLQSHTPEESLKISNFISKLESIFTYLAAGTFGFVGGICKMFLRSNI